MSTLWWHYNYHLIGVSQDIDIGARVCPRSHAYTFPACQGTVVARIIDVRPACCDAVLVAWDCLTVASTSWSMYHTLEGDDAMIRKVLTDSGLEDLTC